MSLECIDRAVKTKLREVYPNVFFGPLSRALELSADENGEVMLSPEDYLSDVPFHKGESSISKDAYTSKVVPMENLNSVAAVGVPDSMITSDQYKRSVSLPLIAVDRLNNPFDTTFARVDPAVRRGRFVNEENEMIRERVMPITPMYQIDIISDRRFEVDEIWRELIYFLYVKPNIEVHYSPGTDEEFVYEYPIRLLDTDNTTDVDRFNDLGIIYRQTISFQVTNAQLIFDKDIKLIEHIPVRIKMLLPNDEVDPRDREEDDEGGKL